MLCYTIVYYAILCYIILYYAISLAHNVMAYNKALTKEELRKWGGLSRKGDKIKFVDTRFKG